MDQGNVEKMKHICDQLGYSYQVINNGTGHDAMMMTDFVPTNMIYIPSKGGITHHPDEWTDFEDVKKGRMFFKPCDGHFKRLRSKSMGFLVEKKN